MNNCQEKTLKDCLNLLNKYCESRDESHGSQHALRVFATSTEIVEKSGYELTDREKCLMTAVAILHDFADHKYSEGTNLDKVLIEFLHKYFGKKDGQLIADMIERISFSKELKNKVLKKDLDWSTVIGERGIFIRNIVSDADKIDATGVVGLKRCIQYTTHMKQGISKKDLVFDVDKHIWEKLGILDQYCRTKHGIATIKIRISELISEFNKWKQE